MTVLYGLPLAVPTSRVYQGVIPPSVAVPAPGWQSITVSEPSVLLPTWNPNNSSAASQAIVNATGFLPQLYMARQGDEYNPGLSPQTQFGVTRGLGPGILLMHSPGTYYVANPNIALEVPFALFPAPIADFVRWWTDVPGSLVVSGAFTPGATGAPARVQNYSAFRRRLIFSTTTAPTFLVCPDGAAYAPGHGMLVATALAPFESPAPWCAHFVESTSPVPVADQCKFLSMSA